MKFVIINYNDVQLVCEEKWKTSMITPCLQLLVIITNWFIDLDDTLDMHYILIISVNTMKWFIFYQDNLRVFENIFTFSYLMLALMILEQEITRQAQNP